MVFEKLKNSGFFVSRLIASVRLILVHDILLLK